MRHPSASLVVVSLFTLFSLAATADSVAPTASPGSPQAAATATPAPTPRPIKCYVQVSAALIEEEKTCAGMNISGCSKNVRTCQWGKKSKCESIVASYCTGMTPHQCKDGIELVTELPKKVPKGIEKYKCQEKSPIKLKKA